MTAPATMPAIALRADTVINSAIWKRHSADFAAYGLELRRVEVAALASGRAGSAERAGLAEQVPSAEQAPLAERAGLAEPAHLADARFLIVDVAEVDRAVIDAAPNCAAIIRAGDGYDNIDIEYATERGIVCCNQPGIWSYETAEFAFVLGLSQARRIGGLAQAHRYPDRGSFGQIIDAYGPIQPVRDLAVGVVGFGNVGREVAALYGRMVKRLYITDTHVGAAGLARFARRRRLRAVARVVPLAETLAHSDIITLHIPMRPQNRHLLSWPEFARMKPTAVVINCARGALVDTVALWRAISAGRIAGAALDLTDPDPLPSDHPLRSDSERVQITPHIAWYSEVALQRMCASVCATVKTLGRGALPRCALNGARIARRDMRLLQR